MRVVMVACVLRVVMVACVLRVKGEACVLKMVMGAYVLGVLMVACVLRVAQWHPSRPATARFRSSLSRSTAELVVRRSCHGGRWEAGESLVLVRHGWLC